MIIEIDDEVLNKLVEVVKNPETMWVVDNPVMVVHVPTIQYLLSHMQPVEMYKNYCHKCDIRFEGFMESCPNCNVLNGVNNDTEV